MDFIKGSMPTSCNATPATRRTSEAWLTTSKPPTVARPEVGRASVVKILIVVLLPAPFGPKNPKIFPASTRKPIPWTAVTFPG